MGLSKRKDRAELTGTIRKVELASDQRKLSVLLKRFRKMPCSITVFQTSRATAVIFGKEDAEHVLKLEEAGTYLLYRDYDTDRLYLSVKSGQYVDHHRINFEDKLYYMDNQPYPYLDSIILYHQRHKLNGVKLTHHAHLSARTVKAFTVKVLKQNGNNSDTKQRMSRDLESDSVIGIEHTNDAVLGQNKISKSSGRLWISGTQKSMTSVRGVYHVLDDQVDSHKLYTPVIEQNGHVVSHADSLEDLSEDIFTDSSPLRQEDDRENERENESENEESVFIYTTHL